MCVVLSITSFNPSHFLTTLKHRHVWNIKIVKSLVLFSLPTKAYISYNVNIYWKYISHCAIHEGTFESVDKTLIRGQHE